MKISPLLLPFCSLAELDDSNAQQTSADFQIGIIKLIQSARDEKITSASNLAMRSSQLASLSASLIETNLNPYLSMPPSTSFRGQIVEYGAFTLLWGV